MLSVVKNTTKHGVLASLRYLGFDGEVGHTLIVTVLIPYPAPPLNVQTKARLVEEVQKFGEDHKEDFVKLFWDEMVKVDTSFGDMDVEDFIMSNVVAASYHHFPVDDMANNITPDDKYDIIDFCAYTELY